MRSDSSVILSLKFCCFILFLAMLSCADPETPPYELPSNAKTLLTADSTKIWKLARRFNNGTRKNMGDCFLAHRDNYSADLTMHNNSGEQGECGETLNAIWKFTKDKTGNSYIRLSSEQLPAMMNIEVDYKAFKVLRLSEGQMTLQYYHKQFSNKATQITDIYVPEDVAIEDREFHW